MASRDEEKKDDAQQSGAAAPVSGTTTTKFEDDAEYMKEMSLGGAASSRGKMLSDLKGMGFDEGTAQFALKQTDYQSVDVAIAFIYDPSSLVKPTPTVAPEYSDDPDYYSTPSTIKGATVGSAPPGVLSTSADAFVKYLADSMLQMGGGEAMASASSSLQEPVSSSSTLAASALRALVPLPSHMEDSEIMEGIKMVIVVRSDLGMSPGKAAAQCCHAAVNLVTSVLQGEFEGGDGGSLVADMTVVQRYLLKHMRQCMRIWNAVGAKKIVLKTGSEDAMLQLHKKACELGINATVIADAGHTELDPGTRTVLGLGPAPNEVIDMVTGKLSLYR